MPGEQLPIKSNPMPFEELLQNEIAKQGACQLEELKNSTSPEDKPCSFITGNPDEEL